MIEGGPALYRFVPRLFGERRSLLYVLLNEVYITNALRCIDISIASRFSDCCRIMKRTSTISRPVEIGLRFIGMWPDSTYATLYWLIYMTTIVIVQYFQYVYVLTHFDLSDISLFMDCLGLTLAYTLAFLKLCVLWWNRR